MDTSPYLPEMSANKRSIGLELKTAEGRAAACALVAKADVFITNYSTPAVRGLGFGYEDLAAINPGLIYVAMPGFGSDPRSRTTSSWRGGRTRPRWWGSTS